MLHIYHRWQEKTAPALKVTSGLFTYGSDLNIYPILPRLTELIPVHITKGRSLVLHLDLPFAFPLPNLGSNSKWW